MKKLIITLMLLVTSCNTFASDKVEWKLAKDKNGIEVYNRSIEGSEFKEFRSEADIDANLSAIIALFNDTSVGTEWVENIDSMEELKHFSGAHTITKTFTKAPWPVKDREAIVESRISQDKDSLVVIIQQHGLPDYTPNENQHVIRVPQLEAQWILTPIDKDRTHLSYRVLTNPGGEIPAWLVNLVSVSQPYHTLLGLMKMVKNEQYTNQYVSYIKNQK